MAEAKNPFGIDRDELDEEWIAQPSLFHEYALKAADARLKAEEAKNELDVVRAELDKEIRERPGKFELEKLTETVIANVILLQPKFREAQIRVNKARHTVDVLQAAVTSLDHRKKALENLVYLHGQDYFATPRASGPDAEIMREVEKKKIRKGQALTRKDLREEDE